jgi:hypothetical protein
MKPAGRMTAARYVFSAMDLLHGPTQSGAVRLSRRDNRALRRNGFITAAMRARRSIYLEALLNHAFSLGYSRKLGVGQSSTAYQ